MALKDILKAMFPKYVPPEQQTGATPPLAAATPRSEPPEAGTGRFYMEIVGESYRQPALRKALKAARDIDDRGRPMLPVLVECEPTNKHDAMACRVVTLAGVHIGYLSRERAFKFHKAIAKVGGAVRCSAVLERWVREEDKSEQIAARIDLCDSWKIPGVKTDSRPGEKL